MNKNKITRVLAVLFFTVSAIDVIGVLYQNSLTQIVFKPLIIISLILLYYFSTDHKNKWYMLALVFSFLGDVFLLDKSNLFLFGIGSFLITQLLYIFIIVKQMKRPSYFHKFLYAFLFANYVVYLLSLLKPNLGDLFYPVLVYGIAISVFGYIATLNYVTKRTRSALVLMLGSILFIISDSLIALYKFHLPQPFYPVLIMITYVVAQYLIFRFMVLENKIEKT